MGTLLDIIMITLFVLFMLFIFGGYHKTKYAKREKDEALQKEEKSLK